MKGSLKRLKGVTTSGIVGTGQLELFVIREPLIVRHFKPAC